MKKRIRRRSRHRSLPGPFAASLFADWLVGNGQRFLVQPQLSRVTRHGADIAFAGVTSFVSARINCDKFGGLAGITVGAEYRGRYWDDLASMEIGPMRQGGVYVCDLCYPNDRDIYASREAMWIELVFEPFLAWCNNKLFPARWLCLYEIRQGTWATLSSAIEPIDETEGEGAAIYLPIRPTKSHSIGTQRKLAS